MPNNPEIFALQHRVGVLEVQIAKRIEEHEQFVSFKEQKDSERDELLMSGKFSRKVF